MSRPIIERPEMAEAVLDIGGGEPLALADYATTGLVSVAVGPRGHGKTNIGLLMAEQLSEQGWVSVLIDPEDEMEALYGAAVCAPEELAMLLESRSRPIVVVKARSATEFVPFGQVLLEAADTHRKPLFVVLDEGQIMSSPKRRTDGLGESSDLIGEFVDRGRKRALDLFITALGFTSSLHRGIFRNKNLTFIGCQEDPSEWSTLAPQFRGSGVGFADLQALGPGQFYCFSRRGIEKVRTPMATKLAAVAPKAAPARKLLPTSFTEWDRAMQAIPLYRLQRLSDPVCQLLGTICGLTTAQVQAGMVARDDEIECRGNEEAGVS